MTARHAATDGSFGRSASGAALRGAGLLVVAVILGILLLRSSGGDPYSRALRTTSPGGFSVVTTAPTATTVTTPIRSAPDIKVLPANGTTASGAANATGSRLKSANYNVLAATNTTKGATTSSVQYAPGYEREARVVAQILGLPDSAVQAISNPPPVADTRDANIIVIVGPDMANRASASTTTTTARRATPTTARTATTARTTPTTARAATTTTKKP
jgi:hypothetical protein